MNQYVRKFVCQRITMHLILSDYKSHSFENSDIFYSRKHVLQQQQSVTFFMAEYS